MIENVDIFEEVRKKITDVKKKIEELEGEKHRNLEIILNVVKAINSSLILEDVLKIVLDNLISLAKADKGCLFLVNGEEVLKCALARNSRGETINEEAISYSKSIVNDVYLSGEPIVIEDVLNYSDFMKKESVVALNLKTIICVPLTVDSERIGVVYVDSNRVSEINKNEILQLFEILAGHAAIAIRNAKLYEKLSKAYADLQSANEAMIKAERMATRGALASEIGHELSNYLTIISINAKLISREITKISQDERLNNSLSSLLSGINKMKYFIRGLLDSAEMKPNKQPSDINSIIRDTIQFVQPLSRYSTVKFIEELDPELPIVNVDPFQIQQLLINLYKNATDARKDATIITRTYFDKEFNRVEIRVADNGPGIPPEVREKLFNINLTTKPGGHGYGLMICKKIVENHNGKIELISEVGNGTEFIISIPIDS
ncbi:GAF domain-containing sensor histidine kinase [Candidatus Chrysopegis kryptomonas]|jgi:signal transduction histidine kinase|uniref:histidine kinase n=1 Tax=Candidatus Chryseopegocella kryptomonas TaxID=1633643 RepID=A0A0P1MW54_9BACT|nr:ATP-binding protein [Candidatus Chrysopegis kryptomonas]CUS99959.1 GAF domain-containing protein [Candidatus Chrysopegis kryptomonas]